MFKDRVTMLWQQIREYDHETTEERYDGYIQIMREALNTASQAPKIREKNVQLIKLKQQHRMAHWKYKTLVA